MLRACLCLLRLLIVTGLGPSDARAHAGMDMQTVATVSAGVEPAGPPIPASPAKQRTPHQHTPGGMSCVTAAGCSGAGSLSSEGPGVPAPGSVATADPLAALRPPRSIDLPLDDRPPRPV